jgi:transposase-like protein
MSKPPQKRTEEFKFKIAVAALRNDQAITDLAVEHSLHPKQIRRWRDQLLIQGKELFIHKSTQKSSKAEPDKEELLHIIEQLSLELEFLKKKLGKKV